jgi:hypothetical protein
MDDSASVSSTTLGIIDRLGKLEGLLVGLQASMSHGQSQVSGFVARVERLEQRQVELEARVVTRDDLKELTAKVDGLTTAINKGQGGAGMLSYLITAGIAAVAAAATAWGVMTATAPAGDASGLVMPHSHPHAQPDGSRRDGAMAGPEI